MSAGGGRVALRIPRRVVPLLVAVVGIAFLAVGAYLGAARRGGACVMPAGMPLVDEAFAFSLCLPGHWRDLQAGDPGWALVYEGRATQFERDVAGGVLDHFAVPLDPPDPDGAVHLAIYVSPARTSATIGQIAEDYARQIRERGDTDAAWSLLTLPVGEVAELTASTLNDISDVPQLDWLNAFIVVTPDSIYYLLFKSSLESRATYERQFESITATFRLLPRPSPNPLPSG
jgi:hypothetical protein